MVIPRKKESGIHDDIFIYAGEGGNNLLASKDYDESKH
jgi:hypothetical protein